MRTVLKYHLPKGRYAELELPRSAKVLMCGAQDDEDYMWCEVNTDVSVEKRAFLVLGTGHPLPTNRSYDHITSWQRRSLVWHLYEFTS